MTKPRPGLGTFVVAAWLLAALHEPARAAGSRGNTPEFYYQPGAGVMQLSFDGHQILSASTSKSVSGVKAYDIKIGNAGFGVVYGYGFSDAWAFSAQIANDNTTLDFTDSAGSVSSYKSTGRSDIRLMLTNVSDFAGFGLYAGIGATLSPSKHLDFTSSADGNNQSGGTSIINYLGLSCTLGSGNYWGTKLQYITRTQRAANTNSSSPQDYSISGGNEASIAAFVQTDMAGASADLAVSYSFIDPVVDTWSGGGTTTWDPTRVVTVEGGAQYQFNSSVNLRLAYQMMMNGDQVSGATTISAFNQSQASLRLRFEF